MEKKVIKGWYTLHTGACSVKNSINGCGKKQMKEQGEMYIKKVVGLMLMVLQTCIPPSTVPLGQDILPLSSSCSPRWSSRG